MIRPEDMLSHARGLVLRGVSVQAAPSETDARRAVSAAYYALFHPLAAEGAKNSVPPGLSGLRERVSRAFDHGQMRRVCDLFARGSWGSAPVVRPLVTLPLSPDLVQVAEAFVALQDARHASDYDLSSTLAQRDAVRFVVLASDALEAWARVRGTPNAAVFLTALLLHERWNRRG